MTRDLDTPCSGLSRRVSVVASACVVLSCRGTSTSKAPVAAPSPPAAPASSASPTASSAERPEAVVVPLQGCAPFYVARTSIGGDVFRLLVDTGSTTTVVAGAECATCAAGGPTFYRPGAGAVPHGKASSTYGGGAGWAGQVVEDALALGAGPLTARVKLVAVEHQGGFLGRCEPSASSPTYQGLLGLGPTFAAMPGTNGFLDELAKRDPRADVMSVELCPSGRAGRLAFGSPTAIAGDGPIAYAPMTDDGMVLVTDFGVGKTNLGLPDTVKIPALLDSGSPVTQLPASLLAILRRRIEETPAFKALFGDAPIWKACMPLPLPYGEAKAQLDALPPMTITFGRAPATSVELPASESYFRHAVKDGKDVWCSGMVEAPPKTPFVVIGSVMMQSHVTVFDRRSRRVGFAPRSAWCEAEDSTSRRD